MLPRCKLPARAELWWHVHLPEAFIQLCELLTAFYFALIGIRVSEEAKVEEHGRELDPWGL